MECPPSDSTPALYSSAFVSVRILQSFHEVAMPFCRSVGGLYTCRWQRWHVILRSRCRATPVCHRVEITDCVPLTRQVQLTLHSLDGRPYLPVDFTRWPFGDFVPMYASQSTLLVRRPSSEHACVIFAYKKMTVCPTMPRRGFVLADRFSSGRHQSGTRQCCLNGPRMPAWLFSNCGFGIVGIRTQWITTAYRSVWK